MTTLVIDAATVVVRDRTIVDAFSLSIGDGDVVALVGPNGAGKTTVLRCILGLVRLRSGSVTFDGNDCRTLSPKVRAGMVAHLAQHAPIDDALTVIEYVAAARFRFDETRGTTEHAAREALAQVDALGLAERRLGQLSGGERQRIAFASVLAQDARILLLDEPASHLDPTRQAQSCALLRELQNLQRAMLIVTHDVNLIGRLKRPENIRILGMTHGRRAFELPYTAEGLCDELSALYGIPMRQFFFQGQAFIAPASEEA